MLRIFIHTELKVYEQHQANIKRTKLREAIKNIVIRQDGQIIEQGLSDYKMVFNLRIRDRLEFNACCHFRIEGRRLYCETKISDYRLRGFIKSHGQFPLIREINRMNMDMIGSKIVLKNRPELVSIFTSYFVDNNFETGTFTSNIQNTWKSFALHFSKLYQKYQRSPDSYELQKLKNQAQQNHQLRPKAIQSSSISCSASPINIQILQKKTTNKRKNEIVIENEYENKSSQPLLRFIEIEQKIEIKNNQKNSFEGGSSVLDKYLYVFYKHPTSSLDMTLFKASYSVPKQSENSDLRNSQDYSDNSVTSRPSKSHQKPSIKLKQNNLFCSRDKSEKTTEESQQKIKCREILVKKCPVTNDPVPFSIQLRIIQYLKDQKCQFLASYFFDDRSCGYQKFRHLDRIYLQFYPYGIQHAKCSTLIILFIKILKGIQFLKSAGIVHRDLKPANILMDIQMTPKIIDFGSSHLIFKNTNSQLKNQIQKHPLRTTRYYNRFYSDIPRQIQQKYEREEFQRHELYDMYAFGRIIKIFLQNGPVKQKLGNFIYQSLSYLSKKCSQQSPDDRFQPCQALQFLQKLQKAYQRILKKLN